MALDVQHDREAKKFHATVDGSEAHLSYERKDEKTLDYKSTYVPPAARGEGVGGELVHHALEFAREAGYRVIPTCPFVKDYVDMHPEYREILA